MSVLAEGLAGAQNLLRNHADVLVVVLRLILAEEEFGFTVRAQDAFRPWQVGQTEYEFVFENGKDQEAEFLFNAMTAGDTLAGTFCRRPRGQEEATDHVALDLSVSTFIDTTNNHLADPSIVKEEGLLRTRIRDALKPFFKEAEKEEKEKEEKEKEKERERQRQQQQPSHDPLAGGWGGDPLRVGPPRGPGVGVGQHDLYPAGIAPMRGGGIPGMPMGPGMGGGSHVGPDHPLFGGPGIGGRMGGPGIPRGGLPPGARFDPTGPGMMPGVGGVPDFGGPFPGPGGPPGSGGGGGLGGGPNPDHFQPPPDNWYG
eukprot:GFYU01003434.1.p1 GENE.GFYU01003434.1~~GFYU01003434.1.p1  ORF type:complete len:326 (+),score=58.41 GFYU01003434.1:40-978(+)